MPVQVARRGGIVATGTSRAWCPVSSVRKPRTKMAEAVVTFPRGSFFVLDGGRLGGPHRLMPEEYELPQARARAAPADNHSIDQEQDDRTHDRRQPGRDVKEVVQRVGVEDSPSDEATE